MKRVDHEVQVERLQVALYRSRRRVRDLRLVLRQLASYVRNHSLGCEVVHTRTESIGCTCGLDDTLKQYHKVVNR